MKKILTTALSIALTTIFICGCSNTDAHDNTSKKLNANLNKLYSVVNNMDTIDNSYINNPDIYSIQTTANMNKNCAFLSVSNINISKTIKQLDNDIDNQIIHDILQNELEKRLNLNNNGYCNNCNSEYNCDENGFCKNCNQGVICDENGNCCYCDNKLSLNNENKCASCNESYLINKNHPSNLKPELINIETSTSQENLEKNLSAYEFVDDSIIEENFKITPLDETSSENDIEVDSGSANIQNEQNTQDNNNNNLNDNETPKIKMYYFTSDSFKPLKLRYNPRFISQYNESSINEQLSNYLYKVQRLYAMTEDALEANNVLKITKVQLLDTIDEVRDLNNCIINGECTPTIQQLQAINNYIHDIKTTIKRLKNCNGDLENEISTINGNVPTSIASSVDVMNSNYMKLINHLDTRITYHESAIATLEQIRFLLEDALNQSEINHQQIEQIIGELNNNNDISQSNTNNDINDITLDNQENNDSSENIIENDTIESVENDTQILSDDVIPNTDLLEKLENEEIEIVVIDPTQSTSATYLNEDTSTDNNEDHNINTDNEDTTEIKNGDENSENDNDEDKTFKNIDTYRPQENNESKNDTVSEENNHNDITTNENIDSNTNIVDNNTINEIPNPAYENTNPVPNNTNNNTFSNSIANDENVINGTTNSNLINDGIYKNSVINQNNLNNNDGYGGYYYTNDGEIKNNGINNNGEYGNNGNTIQNNMNRNNNTNTYGYNTMLDIINQGTVNNGINTL